MLRIGSNISKWKNRQYIKYRSWWSLTTLYSNFFHLKSSNGPFDQVWPKSKHWFLHPLTEPWIVPNGKVMNTKFVTLIKFYILSNGHFPFGKVWTTEFWNFREFIATQRFRNLRWSRMEKSWIPILFHSSKSTFHI